MQKRYHTLENIIFDAIVYLVMAFVLICCLVPFIYMLAVSFSGTKPLINGEVFLWPKDFTLDSYKQIFTYPNFFKAYGNTFLYAVGGTAIALIMTSLMAYPLSKTFLWGNKFFTKMVVVTMFFSGGLIPNYLLLNSLHLVGTRAAMLMPFAINSFNLIILINYFRSIPNEIEEAAIIQDLPWFKRMFRIIIPIQKSAIISGYMLPFMTCLRELSLFLLLCTQGFILSTTLDYFDEMGLYAFSSAINLILIVTILIFNTLVNKLTGASLDDGIGGN